MARVLELTSRSESDELGPRDTSEDGRLKVMVADLGWAWTPPSVKRRNLIAHRRCSPEEGSMLPESFHSQPFSFLLSMFVVALCLVSPVT